ncbi:DUF6575 domain-containing protein [Phocaeicola sp.]
MKDLLKIDKILDYCDMPQLFTARDAFDTLYLCLLYDDEPVVRCTAIRISTLRMETFYKGEIDLRSLFVNPENKGEYFDIVVDDGKYLKTLSKETSLPEEKLPDNGYLLTEDLRENVVINLPLKDRNLLAELVRKFGWACM